MYKMEDKNIIQINIEEEMKQSYIDYAMSVIVGRALPDVRDGLKPVHRRIMYAMHELGLQASKSFKKSARIVGEVLGKYHPHGDTAVYDSLVRMAQEFSLRYPLVKGQGNFGSVDGDHAAHQRYTEAKLMKIADELLKDIEKETVKFTNNFDESLKEPSVLPTKVPNLLINGSSGIAVGMATNIPPHNLKEVCNALRDLLDNEELEYQDLMKHIKGPDFPTSGLICGTMGIKQAYKTGRGKVILRAKADIEGKQIIITEIPYQVNKANLIESIANLVRDKRVEGITNIQDHSDKKGISIVIDTRGAAEIILNQLYKHTQLQTTFGINTVALVNNQPQTLPLKALLTHFLDFRKEVVVNRTKFDLRKAQEKAHILEGLIIALTNIDAIVKLIKASTSPKEAKENLISNYNLSEAQSQAILDMKLQKLTSLEQGKINEDHRQLQVFITECEAILASDDRIKNIIKEELVYIQEKYGDERKTEILAVHDELETEDLIEKEDVVITITNSGYAKRIPIDTYKAQKRGGKGIKGTTTKEEDFVQDLFITNTHSHVLFFSDKGKVYWKKAYTIPEGSRYAKGTPLVNLIEIEKGEQIKATIVVNEFKEDQYLVFATKKGMIKKTALKEYSNPRKGGIIAINLREDDDLINVSMTNGSEEIMIATKDGRAVRFKEGDVSVVGRNSIGVRGINIKESEVIGMEICSREPYILTVTEKGYGKMSEVQDYRLINRGGSGVINIKITEKNGVVTGIKSLNKEEDIIFITKAGIIIRTPASGISIIGRNTQGVRVMRLNDNDELIAIEKIVSDDEELPSEEEE
jgi:DNA gyrase subunit A